ncbi:MAG: hypothetical protein ACMG6S_06210 [Byssovorax sp.]
MTTFALGAHAQSEGGAPTSAATTLWEQALEAMHNQDFASACPKIEEVVRLRPDGLGAKLKLAECYEGAGRLASAWALYALVEPLAEKANQPDRQKTAHDRVEALKPKLAMLSIAVPDAVRVLPGLKITCDDQVVAPAQWGVPLPMNKGRHVIVVTATGMVRGEQAAVIEADGAARTVTLVQPARVKLPAEVKAPGSTKRSAAPAVVLGLLAAGGIGSGIGLMIQASAKDAEALAIGADLTAHYGACVVRWASYDRKRCDQLHGKLEAVDALHDAAVGAFIAGGAAAAGTAVYLLWPSPRDKTMQQAAAHDLRMTPILGPTVSGLLVSGSF